MRTPRAFVTVGRAAPDFRRAHVYRRSLLLCSLLFIAMTAGAASAVADGAPGCPDFNVPKCSIQLSTGITMRYVEVGPRDGLTLFLLHGHTDTSRTWELVVPVLHELLPGWDIIAPDLRGHGQSSLPQGGSCPPQPESCFTWRQFAADIIAFMDVRHIRRAAIVGHSVGTLVAQDMGLDYPDRVSSLTLISTAATGQEPAVEGLLDGVIEGEWHADFTAAGYAWPNDPYNLSPGVLVPDYNDFIATDDVTSSVAPPWLLAQMQPEAAATPLGTWIGVLKNVVTVDNTQRLRHLTVPTLVLYAIQDDIFALADEQALIDSLSPAARSGGSFWWKEYGAVPPPADGSQTDLGRNLPWEAPLGVATDIASFLVRGQPTLTLYRADPSNIHRVLAEPGRALVIHDP
jgi:pimeloyl-ACP methyl ester carboxylesterase